MGCGEGEPAEGAVLPVSVHTLARCDLPTELGQGQLELLALGDFRASNDSAEVLPIDARGTALRFPLATRAIEARVEGAQGRFIGYGERIADDRFDILLWPELESCSVFRAGGAQGYPGKGGGQALGYARRQGLVFAAGGNDPLLSDAIVGALSFDVTTGAVTSFDTSQPSVLREGRAFATVSELGDQLLVAGGENPVFGVPEDDLDVRATAELFDPALGTFSAQSITLDETRTRHAAVQLLDGSVLLVGGRSKYGATVVPQFRAEVIAVKSREATPTVTLAERVAPHAVLLSDGRVFVGGGQKHNGAPAQPAGEWISADGLTLLATTDEHAPELPARVDRALVATPGGGVLLVGGCEDRAADDEEEAASCSACRRGCPPEAYDAHWLDREGKPTSFELQSIVAPQPILLPGSDGSAWLIAARASDPETPRLFRFNPWAQRFSEVELPPSQSLPRPGYPQPIAIDPGAFVWLDESDGHGELFGLRLGTRNRYTQDLALVLLSDPSDPTRPLHLVPDRPLATELGERYDGKLWLMPDVPEPLTVSVADTDYGDVTVRVKLFDDEELQEVADFTPPRLVLGNVELGGSERPWPEGSERGGDADIPQLVRRGARVELRYRGRAQSYAVPEGRLGLAVRTGDGVSIISELDVQRGAPD